MIHTFSPIRLKNVVIGCVSKSAVDRGKIGTALLAGMCVDITSMGGHLAIPLKIKNCALAGVAQ